MEYASVSAYCDKKYAPNLSLLFRALSMLMADYVCDNLEDFYKLCFELVDMPPCKIVYNVDGDLIYYGKEEYKEYFVAEFLGMGYGPKGMDEFLDDRHLFLSEVLEVDENKVKEISRKLVASGFLRIGSPDGGSNGLTLINILSYNLPKFSFIKDKEGKTVLFPNDENEEFSEMEQAVFFHPLRDRFGHIMGSYDYLTKHIVPYYENDYIIYGTNYTYIPKNILEFVCDAIMPYHDGNYYLAKKNTHRLSMETPPRNLKGKVIKFENKKDLIAEIIKRENT